MTLLVMPSSARIRRIQWSLDRPAQINRSAYTGVRRVVANPWHGMWRGQVELPPIIGEANVRAFRGFLGSLKGQINSFKLYATEGMQYTPLTVTRVISNGANTTVTDLTGGLYSIAKSGGVNGTYDADARSTVPCNSDCYVRMRALSTGNNFAVGLNTDPATNSNYTSIDRAVVFAAGSASAYENGFSVFTGAAYGTTEYYFVQRVGGAVYFKKGTTTDPNAATVLWQFNDLDGALYFDSAFAASAATAEVMFSGDAEVTARSSAAQAATSIDLVAESGTLRSKLFAGMFATVALPSGNNQLVLITSTTATTDVTINFEPPLREAISSGALIHVKRPFAQVALADSAFGWSVDPGTQYGISFGVEEAF